MTEFYQKLHNKLSFSHHHIKWQPSCLQPETTPPDNEIFNFGETPTEESNIPQICHALYLKEIRQLNPQLSEGQLFVDGLFELISREIPWPMTEGAGGLKTRPSPKELFSLYNLSSLLLARYWTRPDNSDELSSYLTVGASFVEYVLKTHGPLGLSQLLSSLPSSGGGCGFKPNKSFSYKGDDLFSLELKWKRFVEGESAGPFSLTHFGLLVDLCKKYYKYCSFRMTLVFMIILINVSLQLGLAISFSYLLSLGFSASRSDLRTTFIWSAIVLTILITRFILANIAALLVNTVTIHIGLNLRWQVARRIHCVSYTFFSEHTPGSILSTFSKDISSIESFISVSMTTLLWACLMLIACIAYAITMVWPLGLSLCLAYIVSHAFSVWLSSFLGLYNLRKNQALDKSNDLFKEMLDGYKENRIYRCASFWLSKLEGVLKTEYSPQSFKSNQLVQFVVSFQMFIPHVLGVLLMLGIVLLSDYEWVEFEDGVSVYLMYQLTLMAVSSASGHFSTLESARVSMSRINSLLYDESHNMKELNQLPDDSLVSALLRSRLSCHGRRGVPVSFEGVSFCYSSSASHWTLYDVSFRLGAGEKMAIVGESGCGKSTLLSLILQVLLPTEGSVLIAGQETTGRPDGSAVAIFQSNHIFATSLRENVRLGRLDAEDEEIEEACQLAGLGDWIEGLPRGYDTLLRSSGGHGWGLSSSSLSGGQVQRIGLARMLLSNAPVLLLDEMTSALDPLTESKVFTTVMDATSGKTLISVTHKIEQAKVYDKIMVLSHGRIKEIGSHFDLMSREGHYYRLVKREEGVASPSRPTPIQQRHSLSHLAATTPLQSKGVAQQRVDTPIIIEPIPVLIKATPLQTVDEEPSHLGSTILYPRGSNEGLSPLGSGYHSRDERNLSIENPFPQILLLPSSTPNKLN